MRGVYDGTISEFWRLRGQELDIVNPKPSTRQLGQSGGPVLAEAQGRGRRSLERGPLSGAGFKV